MSGDGRIQNRNSPKREAGPEFHTVNRVVPDFHLRAAWQAWQAGRSVPNRVGRPVRLRRAASHRLLLKPARAGTHLTPCNRQTMQCTEFTTRNAQCRRLATLDGRCAFHAQGLRIDVLESSLAEVRAERDALRRRAAQAEATLAKANDTVMKLVDIVRHEKAEKNRLQTEKDQLSAELGFLELELGD